MKLFYFDEEIECDEVVRGIDYIKCFQNGNVVLSFEGIHEFELYHVEGGSWTSPLPTQQEIDRADIDYLLMLSEDI